jgi:hypothetical protein
VIHGSRTLGRNVEPGELDRRYRRGRFSRVSGTTGAVTPGQTPETVAARMETDLGGVTAQSQRQFAEQERRIVRDMATDLTAIMNAAGLLIGLAVMALTI